MENDGNDDEKEIPFLLIPEMMMRPSTIAS